MSVPNYPVWWNIWVNESLDGPSIRPDAPEDIKQEFEAFMESINEIENIEP